MDEQCEAMAYDATAPAEQGIRRCLNRSKVVIPMARFGGARQVTGAGCHRHERQHRDAIAAGFPESWPTVIRMPRGVESMPAG